MVVKNGDESHGTIRKKSTTKQIQGKNMRKSKPKAQQQNQW